MESATQSVTFNVGSMSNLVEVLQLYLPSVTNSYGKRIKVEENRKIGFEQNKNGDTAAVTERTATVTANGYRIKCRYCGTEAVMKSPQAIYCCDEHRIADHRRTSYQSGKEASLSIPFGEK